MADIARILTEVTLQAREAIATWKQFGDAGVQAFRQVAAAAVAATTKASAGMARLNERMRAFGAAATAVGRSIRQTGQAISVGITAPVLLFGRAAINSFKEAQAGLAILEAQFKNVGKAVRVPLEEMKNFAQTTQQSLAVSDDAVIEMQATLLKFTNVTGEQFKEARDIIIDYAQASGQELPAAAQVIGQALNDPIRGLRALRQAGIALSNEQRAQITQWVQTGNVVQAQELILEAFQKRYRGVAADFAATDTGKAQIQLNLLDDAMEQLGERLIPIQIAFVTALTTILDAFNALPQGVQTAIIAVVGFAAVLGPLLFIIGGLVTGLGYFTTALTKLPVALRIASTAFGLVVRGVTLASAAVAAVGLWPILVAAALGALVVVVITYWDEIVSATKTAWDAVANFIGQRISNIKNFFSSLGNLISAAWNALFDALSNRLTSWVNSVKNAVDRVIGFFRRLIEMAKTAIGMSKAAAGAGAGDSGGGFAGGGRVRGRGGIDRIAAWLTNNEFVHRVAAVRKYGLGFMHAVNSGQFPLALARGYSGGGFVGAPRMAYATGGAVRAPVGQGDRGFTLVIDGKTFGGLRAPADTADDLVRFSREKQLRSTGRAPAWFR